MPNVNIGASQIQRLMQHFGNLEETEEQLTQSGFEANKSSTGAKEILYVQVDGGHLLTDEGYKETKVGRIFKGSHLKRVSSDNEEVRTRNKLDQSDYIAQLGHYKNFTNRFDKLLNNHIKDNDYDLVFISDGAEWIANWQLEKYPSATIILDFYHAYEHLGKYAKKIFSSEKNKAIWMKKRKEELLNGQLDDVITAIKEKCSNRCISIQNEAEGLINYYEKNRYRMKYDEYLEKGYCIGSGAIESAISTVVQQRCKLVGQRWTERVQAVLNIRALHMSGKKENLKNIINAQMGHPMAA